MGKESFFAQRNVLGGERTAFSFRPGLRSFCRAPLLGGGESSTKPLGSRNHSREILKEIFPHD